MSTKKKIIVSFDIGTTHSGYAYQFAHEPEVVHTSSFNGKQKTPASVLLDKNGKFVAYGEEAEDKYMATWDKGNNTTKLFSKFKMTIHHNATLNKATTVPDLTGKYGIPVFDLLVMSLRYLKNHMMRWINRSTVTYNEDDALFVVLVPAIFDDRAKWLVREAALKAGMDATQLMLALEAETSSLWCQHENINDIKNKGTRYIVCDIGGGTVDIAAHESCGDGSVDSIYYPSGGDWAGIQVDNCLKSYLVLLFGTQSIECLIQEHPADWFTLLKNYEKAKHGVVKQGCTSLAIDIPECVRRSAVADKGFKSMSELSDLIKSPNFGGHFKLEGDALVIDEEAIRGLYTYTVNSIVGALDKMYQKGVVIGENIDRVLFVGGLVNSPTFREILQKSLNRYNTTFVQDSDMFAVKGGVLYGHQKSLVHTRVTPLTYGIRTTVPYNDNKHKDGQTTMMNGVKMCTDNFHVLVKAGTVVNCGQEMIELDKPLTPEDTEQIFEIYSCGLAEEVPSVVTHYSTQKEAFFTIPLPFGRLVDDKMFERCVVLGEPELLFRITFKKGKKDKFVKTMSY